MDGFDLFDDRVIFFPLRHVDFIIGIIALAGPVGWDFKDF